MVSEKEIKVIDAAQGLFHRHGVRRVTMNDIAAAAGMSRPALYQIFPNKETIFETVVRVRGGETLSRIREGVATWPHLQDKLAHAFEVWTVGAYEIILHSPDAHDLIECEHGLAEVAMAELHAGFEKVIEDILSETPPACSDAGQLAHLITCAAYGFRAKAQSVDELRKLLQGLISMLIDARLPYRAR